MEPWFIPAHLQLGIDTNNSSHRQLVVDQQVRIRCVLNNLEMFYKLYNFVSNRQLVTRWSALATPSRS